MKQSKNNAAHVGEVVSGPQTQVLSNKRNEDYIRNSGKTFWFCKEYIEGGEEAGDTAVGTVLKKSGKMLQYDNFEFVTEQLILTLSSFMYYCTEYFWCIQKCYSVNRFQMIDYQLPDLALFPSRLFYIQITATTLPLPAVYILGFFSNTKLTLCLWCTKVQLGLILNGRYLV